MEVRLAEQALEVPDAVGEQLSELTFRPCTVHIDVDEKWTYTLQVPLRFQGVAADGKWWKTEVA